MPRARPASSSKSTPSKPLKRPLPPNSTDPNTLTPPARQSKRLKSSSLTSSTTRTTPKKSQYFSHSSTSEPESEIEAEASGYEDEDASVSAVSSPPVSDDEEDEEDHVSSEEDKKPRQKAKGRIVKKPASNGKSAANGVAATAKAIVEKGKELWRPGVKSDLAPGEEVFIKLPKARSDGGVKYKEGILHPNTMLFLGDLKENNDREWLKIHDADYRQSKKDFDAFVEKMTERMTEIDETIPELPPKDLVKPRIRICSEYSADESPRLSASTGISALARIQPLTKYVSSPKSLQETPKAPSHPIGKHKELMLIDTLFRRMVPHRSERSIRRLLPPDQALRLLYRRWSLVSRGCSFGGYASRH
ncbi:MAG: hypothetical protein L6R40_003062 [Gallowayella cf. fulva]|nr:MAG: hypothetical protein L6R40_003062 [Xanthomendoza cf. fulva]